MKNLADKVAIITGGSSGLGKAIAYKLAEEQCKIVLSDVNQQEGEKIVQDLNSKNNNQNAVAIFVNCDVTNEEEVKNLIKVAVETFKKINIVINSAGVASAQQFITSEGKVPSTDLYETVFKINVLGTFNVSKYAAQQMIKQPEIDEQNQRGVIVNISSIASFEGQKGLTVYSGTKAAVNAMTLPMARDLGRYGIRVVTLAPGIFVTPMSDHIQKKYIELYKQQAALNRLGVPKELAMFALGVIKNSYATGCVYRIDGGIRMSNL